MNTQERRERFIVRCVVCHRRIGYDDDPAPETDVCDACDDYDWKK